MNRCGKEFEKTHVAARLYVCLTKGENYDARITLALFDSKRLFPFDIFADLNFIWFVCYNILLECR